MREIVLSGKYMTNIISLHKYLQSEMILPEGKGGSLDSLWDCLMEIEYPTHITLIHMSDMLDEIYEYGEEVVQLFCDACIENENLSFDIAE